VKWKKPATVTGHYFSHEKSRMADHPAFLCLSQDAAGRIHQGMP
jgi:hypothetical protein